MTQSLYFHILTHDIDFCDPLQQEAESYFKQRIIITHAQSLLEISNLCAKQCPHLLMLSTPILPDPILPTLLDFKKTYPTTKIILQLAAQDTRLQQNDWMGIVNGGVLKSDSVSVIFTAVISVVDGFNYFSPAIHEWITNSQQVGNTHQLWTSSAKKLTVRERQIISILVQGHSNRQIAQDLNLAYQTVRNILNQLYKKLDVHSRVEAINWALDNGLPRE
ncbi:MAG: response regulator transcription factor [Chloroflexi bacterium]|nr:response regulator transcription factor [Chloroflexota bacterium]